MGVKCSFLAAFLTAPGPCFCGVADSGHLSEGYRSSQTDPVRIALMDDLAQRQVGKGYWRLEDLDAGNPCWPFRMDDIIAAVHASSTYRSAL